MQNIEKGNKYVKKRKAPLTLLLVLLHARDLNTSWLQPSLLEGFECKKGKKGKSNYNK